MGRNDQAGARSLREALGNIVTVVLAGRANVGKSTLFNRIARGRHAITSPIAGTTRDLNVARVTHDNRAFALIDSGGLEFNPEQPESGHATREALRAITDASIVVLVVDGRAGITTNDREALATIRETGRPLIVAVNKIDNPAQDTFAAEAYALGVERIVNVSAAHGRGVDELLDQIVAALPDEISPESESAPDLRFALIGRPNVGKSSLFNRLAGFERAIVADRPGTTRDPVDIRIASGEQSLLLVDTAGIRRPTKVEGDLEQHAVGRAIETIRRAEVLGLVIDATEGVTDQDARLARLVETNGRALILICNKWDAAATAGRKVPAFVRQVRHRFPFLDFAPLLFTSALTGDGVNQIAPSALRSGEAWRAQFQTAQLNRILADALAAMDPPLVAGRRLKLMYVTQTASAPPRLAFFTNLERDIPEHYARFLEARFRAALHLEQVGVPLRLEFRRAERSLRHRAAASS